MNKSLETNLEIDCEGFLVSLERWLTGELLAEPLDDQVEPTETQMRSHYDFCDACQIETKLTRNIASIAHSLPELVRPQSLSSEQTLEGGEGSRVGESFLLHGLRNFVEIWSRPLVFVPACALLLVSFMVFQWQISSSESASPLTVLVTVNGEEREYTQEEVIAATEELKLALSYLDKYRTYPGSLVRTKLHDSGFPLQKYQGDRQEQNPGI